MKKILSLVLIVCTLVGTLCMQSCGLLSSFLEGQDLADYYDLKTGVHFARDLKVTSEASYEISVAGDGQSMYSSIDATVSLVGMNVGKEDMVYDRNVTTIVKNGKGSGAKIETNVESASYFDGKAYFSGTDNISGSSKKIICGTMTVDEYLNYLDISAIISEDAVLQLDVWAEELNVYGKDKKDTISFEYTGIAEEHMQAFEGWIGAMTQISVDEPDIVECKKTLIYDEKKCVLNEEQITVEVGFEVSGYYVSFVYTENNKYSDPLDTDKPDASKYAGARDVGDFSEVMYLLGYVGFIAYPSKENNESYAFDMYKDITYKEDNKTIDSAEASERIELGYDSDLDDKYHYESVSMDGTARCVYDQPNLSLYKNGERISLEKIDEIGMKQSVKLNLIEFMINMYDVTKITEENTEDGKTVVKISFEGHEDYLAAIGISSANVSGNICVEYGDDGLESISAQIVTIFTSSGARCKIVENSRIDNFGDASFDSNDN
ncbi:MAG: hypothetical protein IJY69_00865 [Clostridia bacterium]|nr:hypothetical protein [Clostridia bacterium]